MVQTLDLLQLFADGSSKRKVQTDVLIQEKYCVCTFLLDEHCSFVAQSATANGLSIRKYLRMLLRTVARRDWRNTTTQGEKFMKKRLMLLLCTLLLMGCVPIGSADNATTVKTPLKVCYSAVGTVTQSLPIYAFEKGIYAKYGLDVQLVNIEGGDKATAALIAGQMDICQVAGSAVVNGVVAGADVVLIAGLVNTYAFYLITRPEIQSAADLQGKTVAISSPGGSTDAATRLALQSLGLRPEQDVTIVSMNSESNRLAAMATGAIAGTVIGVPMQAKARELGYHKLVDIAALKIPYPNTTFATSHAFIADHHDTALRFIQANIEAIATMKQDKAGAIAAIAKFMGLDGEKDTAMLEETYQEFVLGYLPDMPYPEAEGVQTILDGLVAKNPAAAKITPADVIDTSLLDEIAKSGFVKK